jgi:hypothetical protein
MANEWRQHPLLKGRFLPDYPDDLQVIVHDGGPKITSNEPEIVWVTVTAMDGDVFHGRVFQRAGNRLGHRDGDGRRRVPRSSAEPTPGPGHRPSK